MSVGIELALEDAVRVKQMFLAEIGGIAIRQASVVAGSIRRRRPKVHDVDLVIRQWEIVPSDFELFMARCQKRAEIMIKKWGTKVASLLYREFSVDLYFAAPETFHTLLLIRTGSKENNIRLAMIAKRKGWKLHASGDGLFNELGERIAGDSERSIYDVLGVPWQEPWERG